MSEPLLMGSGLTRDYRMGPTALRVLDDVSLTLDEGEVLGVIGHSGAGKSTLVHLLGLLDHPTSGDVRFDGVAMGHMSGRWRARVRNQNFGFVFQFYHLLPELSALENVLLPRMIRSSLWSWPGARRDATRRAEELLESVGLTDRRDHRPAQLSGGERQRVAIARALMNKPRVLFCDEPTGNLDTKTSAHVQSLLWDLRAKTGMSMLVVTHDATVADRADRVIRLIDGRVVGEGGGVAPTATAGDSDRPGDSV